MTDTLFKVIAIKGIRVNESEHVLEADARAAVRLARYQPGFVFVALYVSYSKAPLSGRTFGLVQRFTRRLTG